MDRAGSVGPARGPTGRIRWTTVFGLWTLPALVAASQTFVREAGSVSWVTALLAQLPSWWIWALLTPAVLRLARAHPIGRGQIAKPLVIHALWGSLAVLVYIVAQAPFAILREGRTVTIGAWAAAVLGGLLFQYLSQLLIYFGIVAIGHALDFRSEADARQARAARLEAELAAARASALRARLQPHFLFNTLHTVGGLVREGRKEDAISTLTGLSGLLRFTLDAFDDATVPMHWELEALEQYLAIQELRFGDRLDVVRSIDPSAVDWDVPALVLQPLVENAIAHGMSEARALTIQVGVRLEGDALHLTVTDDGVGLPRDFDLDESAGLGLRLTRDRIRSIYPTGASFEVRPNDPTGVRAELVIPRPS